jgi:ribonuclease P protein component
VVRYGFPSRYKLKKTDDFSSVFSFRRRFYGECLVLHHQPNTLAHARLGIVVGKKIAKRAVARNYMRRVLREWFRLNREQIGAQDLVMRVQKAFRRNDRAAVDQELQQLLLRLKTVRARTEKPDGKTADLAG